MNNKIIVTSILPIISISSGIILNYHLNSKIQKNRITNKINIKKNLHINKGTKSDKTKNNSFISHNSFNDFNITSKTNKTSDLKYRNVSIVLNHSFNKGLIFAPYIYHFYYKKYEKNKNGVYQLVSHDAKIWMHSKIVHAAYPFLDSTYLKIVGVRGNNNNLQINQNFKLSTSDLKNAVKNTLQINVDAIGLVSNPHIYFNYHYKLKKLSKTILNNKKHNLKKYIIKENNDDYFGRNLTNLRSHFNNYQIKMFGYYKVFNLNLSARSWFTHNLINALLMLLPITIDIFANMFCGIVSGLIMGSITSQIKNFIISFNLNLIDSTLTKGYLGYAYMAGDTLFAMGESEMEFIASGVGDFFVTGKSIHGMSKTFSDEQSKTEVIEYAGDDDMREKLDNSDNVSVSTNQSFSYSHNASEQENNNNNIQPPLDNQVQNSHSNMNTPIQANAHNENLSLIPLENNSNILVNNNDLQPVAAEENSYEQYSSQLVSNNYSSRIIQEDPHRGNKFSRSTQENHQEDIDDTDSAERSRNNSSGIKVFKATSKKESDEERLIEEERTKKTLIRKNHKQLMMKKAYLMPDVFDGDYDSLHLVDLETGFRAENIEELMRLKMHPTLMDRIRYLQYTLFKIERTDVLQEYNFPSEIDYDELALKQIRNENTGAINHFEIPFSEATIKYTRQELFKPWKDYSLIDYLLSKDVLKFDFQKFIQLSSLDYMEKHIDYSEAKLFLYRVKWTNITIYFEWMRSFGNEEKIIELLLHPDYEIRRQLFSTFKEDYSSQRQVIPNESDLHIVDENKLKFMSLNYFYYLIILYNNYSLEFYNSLCYARHEFENARSNFTFIEIFQSHLDTKFVHKCGNLKFEGLKKFNAISTLKGKIQHLKERKFDIEESGMLLKYDFVDKLDYEQLILKQFYHNNTEEEVLNDDRTQDIFHNVFEQYIIKFTKRSLFKPWEHYSLIDYLLSGDKFDILKFTQSLSLDYMAQYIEYSEAKLFLHRMKRTYMGDEYLDWVHDFKNEDGVIKMLLDPRYVVRRELVSGQSFAFAGNRLKLWDDSPLDTEGTKLDFRCRFLKANHFYYLSIAYRNYNLDFLNSFRFSSYKLNFFKRIINTW